MIFQLLYYLRLTALLFILSLTLLNGKSFRCEKWVWYYVRRLKDNGISTDGELLSIVKLSKKKKAVSLFPLVYQSQISGLYEIQVTFFACLFMYSKIFHPLVMELGGLPRFLSFWEFSLSIPCSCVGPVQ